MKIALVHDYLSQDGGAEQVLQAFHEIWPDAPIFVLFYDKKNITRFKDADIRESFLGRLPGIKKHYQWFLPFMPLATETHSFHGFDVVLSSTSAFSKGIITGPDTIHISYCHTPTRYLWSDTKSYIHDLKKSRLIKFFLPPLIHKLRQWDFQSVSRVDYFIANSKTVQKRIKKYYGRTSKILYPPVNIPAPESAAKPDNYFVTGGRLVPYKRFDLTIEAFNRLGWPLMIFGSGPEMKQLKKIAKDNIIFVGNIPDAEKISLMQHAAGFIHPQEEDAGITPLESMLCGRPVIAFRKGGATETILEGTTGVFFDEQSWPALYETLIDFKKMAWNSSEIMAHAQKFSKNLFKQKIKEYVTQKHVAYVEHEQ